MPRDAPGEGRARGVRGGRLAETDEVSRSERGHRERGALEGVGGHAELLEG